MSKLGYFLAALLILGLGAYAWWPVPTVVTGKLLATPVTPAAWTVRVGDQTQHATREQVTVTRGNASYVFATDPEKFNRIWSALGGIEAPEAKIITGVGADQLGGYGLDGTREAVADDGAAVVRWGGSGGQAYVWNGVTRTLIAVAPQVVAGLDAAAGQVGRTQVLMLPTLPKSLTIDGLMLVLDGGSWQAELFRNRPPFDARVTALLGLLSRTAIDDLDGIPVIGLPVLGNVQIPALDGSLAGQAGPFANGPLSSGPLSSGPLSSGPLSSGPLSSGPLSSGPLAARTVTVYDSGISGAIAISGYPAQRLDPALLAELRPAFAAFKRDILLELYTRVGKEDVLRVVLTRDGKPWWSLFRREKPPESGGFLWDVVWDGGRENARDDTVDQLARLLSEVAVRDPRSDTAALERLPADGILVEVTADRPGTPPVRFAVAGGELRTATHRARLVDDGVLERSLTPDQFLDQRLTRRDAARVAKVQRRFHDETPPRDEVVTRSEGGSWVRTYPAAGSAGQPPADGPAVDRLVRVLAAAEMRDVRIVALDPQAAESRALLAAPEFEFDVRFAAVAGGQASNDDTDLDLSAAQDWGIALRRSGERWQAVDKDLGLAFTLDADTVDELRRPFSAGQVFPVVATAVTGVAITRSGGNVVRLTRDGQRWLIDGQEADAVAVRRWFRLVGSLQVPAGSVLDARIPEPDAGESVASITCDVPAVTGDPFQKTEQLTLVALAAGAQGQPVHVWSNRGGSRFTRGRTVLPAATVAELFVDAASFRK